jgi:RNA binding exosome subunit
MTLEVISAKISAIVHATEDVDRVLQALSRVFPDGSLPSKAETRRFELSICPFAVHPPVHS